MKMTIFFSLIIIIFGCNNSTLTENQIQREINKGNFTRASQLIDCAAALKTISLEEEQKLLFTKDSLRRVMLDFNKNIDDVVAWIKENHGFEPTENQINDWEQVKALEYRIIDQQKKYFRNAAPNLFRVSESAKRLSNQPSPTSDTPTDSLLSDALKEVNMNDDNSKYTLPPKTMKVSYSLTVKPNVVKDGDLIRAWLPYPRKDIARQTNVKFISASQLNYILSNDRTVHTSMYMEQKAVKDVPTVFSVEYEFTSQGEWFNFEHIENAKANTKSIDNAQYTTEKIPHILFTDELKTLTDKVTQNTTTTSETVSAIYHHIVTNYPWASALEYSTIFNIPEYVIENKKGDCGQVALLLITMLRYKGIPARWQSGWMMHPGEVNLHDWAEYYVDGVGWIPIDVSFGRGGDINNPVPRYFYISGIDSYRLYVNNDIKGNFYPEKKFPRSETVDFQRGEVETNKENVYFDKWTYKMQVEYQ
ncbi:MAG: transglutaminase-like domain-containing protein [Candidatus Saccharimonadaceae bacterium]